MIFKISNDQFFYLKEELGKESSGLLKHLEHGKQKDNSVQLDIDEDAAIAIRDWAGEKLQKEGFDENYEVTKEGSILEDIIDALYA